MTKRWPSREPGLVHGVTEQPDASAAHIGVGLGQDRGARLDVGLTVRHTARGAARPLPEIRAYVESGAVLPHHVFGDAIVAAVDALIRLAAEGMAR